MSETREPGQELADLYNEVDAYMRQQYKHDKYSDHTSLILELAPKNRVIARHQQEMRAVAQIRNIIIHNAFGYIVGLVLQPHPEVVKRYRAIRDALLHPADALSIAILAHRIYTASMDTSAITLLKTMNKNIYTHIPIMDGDALLGIFKNRRLTDRHNRWTAW